MAIDIQHTRERISDEIERLKNDPDVLDSVGQERLNGMLDALEWVRWVVL